MKIPSCTVQEQKLDNISIYQGQKLQNYSRFKLELTSEHLFVNTEGQIKNFSLTSLQINQNICSTKENE